MALSTEVLVQIILSTEQNPFEFRLINHRLYDLSKSIFPTFIKRSPFFHKMVYSYETRMDSQDSHEYNVRVAKIISGGNKKVTIRQLEIDVFPVNGFLQKPRYLFSSIGPIRKRKIFLLHEKGEADAKGQTDYFKQYYSHRKELKTRTWILMDSTLPIYTYSGISSGDLDEPRLDLVGIRGAEDFSSYFLQCTIKTI